MTIEKGISIYRQGLSESDIIQIVTKTEQYKANVVSKYLGNVDYLQDYYRLSVSSSGIISLVGSFQCTNSFSMYYSPEDGGGSNAWPMLFSFENVEGLLSNSASTVLIYTADLSEQKSASLDVFKDQKKVEFRFLNGTTLTAGKWYQLTGMFLA